MLKIRKTRHQLEAMLLQELHRIPGCDGVVSVTVSRLDDGAWALTAFNPGHADNWICVEALRMIVTRLRPQYELCDDPLRRRMT
jgi:hypothetical protein